MKLWLFFNLVFTLVLITPAQTDQSAGRYEKFLRIRVEEQARGTVLTDVWYLGFVREVPDG